MIIKDNPLSRPLNNFALTILLLLNGFLLVLPKLALIQFTNRHLWGEISIVNLAGAIAQDLLVAMLVTLLCIALLRVPTRLRVVAAAITTGALLAMLMIDMRVRELWLKPLDISLLHYAFENAVDLTSGFDLFFNKAAFLSFTFKRFLFLVALAGVGIWCAILWMTLVRKTCLENAMSPRNYAVAAVAGFALLLVVFTAPQYRYRMNENIVVSSFVAEIKKSATVSRQEQSGIENDFEEPANPLNSQLMLDRKILKNIKPFNNVVVVVYESVRWRDLNILGEGPSLSPVLSQLAANGLVTRAFVSVPHSSKAYFAILTGRHPYPGIEIRELFRERNDSIWHDLRNNGGVSTYAFSSMFFGFEGMGKLLKSFGIDARYESADLEKSFGAKAASTSSFGTSDEHLYGLGAQLLNKVGGKFAAVFFPSAAHYPYECRGAVRGRHSRADYDACLAESDANLESLLSEFRRLNLMEDTLFVIVGDHGESFGEHGLYVHNSSMYDEEVVVPLVFWSQDGRLAGHQIPYGRQIDIAPTIADLLGYMSSNTLVQGVSLLRQQNEAPAVFMATFFDGLGAAIYERPFKYLFDPSTENVTAFDQAKDPFELSPLRPSDEKTREVVERIRSFLAYQERAFPSR